MFIMFMMYHMFDYFHLILLPLMSPFTPAKPTLETLEYILNFERFNKPKTIDNVSERISKSLSESNIKDGDINQLSADGAANSIGAVSECEALSRTHRSNDLSSTVCLAHQNTRSGGLASGTIEVTEPQNAELGTVIKDSRPHQPCNNSNESIRSCPGEERTQVPTQAKDIRRTKVEQQY